MDPSSKDLSKALAKSRLSGDPKSSLSGKTLEAIGHEEVDNFPDVRAADHLAEDDSSSASSASSASSTGTVIPSSNQKLFARPQDTLPRKTFAPIPWTTYFERELWLKRGESTHHTYLTSPVGKGPLFVTHHGAGSSGLSFAVLAAELRKILPSAGILSLDARNHGLTSIGALGDEQDLGLTTLCADLVFVVTQSRITMGWESMPSLVLVGHSLGGAVVTTVAKDGALGSDVLGYAVLDVVEGSAIDALQSMQTYLSTRPLGFGSTEAGIEWHIRSRTLRNTVSARVSVPALLRQGGQSASKAWQWRTDLASTRPFWEDWFVGLSRKFLEARGGKLLILAGTDRLDKELIIGQMQGKYALQVFPEAGHFVHEDLPEKTAMCLADFYKRNDRSIMVLPPKVSDLLKAGIKV